jgi:hypothetical protein
MTREEWINKVRIERHRLGNLGADRTLPVILIRAKRNMRKLPVCPHISPYFRPHISNLPCPVLNSIIASRH